jgi:glutamate-ammonia-ligase adenylyltransferase
MRERLRVLCHADSVRRGQDEVALNQALRYLRQEVMLVVMQADLAGQIDLDQVMHTMSDLAEVTLQHAAQYLYTELARAHGVPLADGVTQAFLVIAMGKLGGRELNVSSDIDLIFAYAEDGETEGGLPNQEFFTQLARRLIKLISEVNEHGFVFRVDMRLRPNGDAGALVSSFAALERYFYEQGREWERYAWIKARVVASACTDPLSPHSALVELENLRRPFVFRKYLDYGAVGAIRELHRQIRAERSRRNAAHPNRANDVKLGRGGIREIEFIAQLFQLIRGGRVTALQSRPTRQTLATELALGLIEPDVAADLDRAYVFLRALEHRLQYVDDAQTHALPAAPEEQERIAAMMGYDHVAALHHDLEQVRSRVAQVFDGLFDAENADPQATPSWFSEVLGTEEGLGEAERDLAQLGFAEAADLAHSFAAFVRSTRFRSLPAQSRQRLDSLIRPMLTAALAMPTPECTVKRFLNLLDTIARRSAYLALLAEHPSALRRVASMLGASPWGATYLTRHPLLLDELIDERAALTTPDWLHEGERLNESLRHAVFSCGQADVERRMDLLREFHQLWTFRLLAEDLAGRLSVEILADHLSALADLLLQVALEQAWAQMLTQHCAEPRFAVIAYGKLGGKELGYASDLDLIFVYDDPDERAPEIYARLAQRMMNWLTSHTSAGRLFNVDLRLRPNGSAGLLVSSIEAFAQYQLGQGSNAAWLWEHQALTRSRFCAGHVPTGEKFTEIRHQVMTTVRQPQSVLKEIAAMRQKIHDGHPNATTSFDLKHDSGGMVDIEFIVQALVLLHSHRLPALAANSGNIALLRLAGDEGLLPQSVAYACADAYRAYRARQHGLRLQSEAEEPPPARVEGSEFIDERAAVQAAWRRIFEPIEP